MSDDRYNEDYKAGFADGQIHCREGSTEVKPHSKLTPAEEERLYCLIEELGEAIQAASKVLRHGYWTRSPFVTDASRNNKEDLEKEMGDVLDAILTMNREHDISYDSVIEWSRQKREAKVQWMHHQGGRT